MTKPANAPMPPVVRANPYLGRFQPLPPAKAGAKCPITHLCRSSIYNAAAREEARLVKINGKVYLDVEHWLARVQSAPALEVKRAGITPRTDRAA